MDIAQAARALEVYLMLAELVMTLAVLLLSPTESLALVPLKIAEQGFV